jgi:hypothetical protein
MTKPRIDSVHVTDRSVGGITYESQRIAQGLSSREATKDGAFMEPSGRNRWQSVANGAARNVAQTSENRCCGLRRVDGKEGVDGSSPSEGFQFVPAQKRFLLSDSAPLDVSGVHAASTAWTSVLAPVNVSSSLIVCSRPSRARWP